MDDNITITEAKERQLILNLSREDLEDRYLRLREENVDLKKTTHKQEEKMKQMATKLLRLVKDKKKLDEGVGGFDIEARDKIEELKSTISLLEKQNYQLKSKLTVAKQQLQTHGKRTTPYDHVKSRINTNAPSKKLSSHQQRIKEQIRVQGSPPPFKASSNSGSPRPSSKGPHPVLPQPRYGHSLLEEARLEKRELEDVVANLQEQVQEYEDKIELLEMQIQQKDLNHEEDLQSLRQRVSGTQRNNIQENIELIKLQREVKDKVTKLQHLQGKYQNLEELLTKVKSSHEQVLDEMESLTTKLREEKDKNLNLQNEMKQGNISHQTLAQKEEEISDLKEEIILLKEAHSKLINSTFDVEKDREFRTKERQYKVRIAQLEATIKADVTEKNQVLDRLTSERDVSETSKKDFRELQIKYYEIKEKHDELNEKLKFFTQESSADFEEIQEALLLIKTKKERESHNLDFLQTVDDDMNRDLNKKMNELQAAHAETINELEKTRSMLLLQHNINKDYQKEVENTTKKMNEVQKDCDLRVKEYAELLDIRAQRIKKLEAQLRDVAYGTKQYKIKSTIEVDDEPEEDIDIQLERGQNVFEIHIGKMCITKHGLTLFNNVLPMTFVSYEFFEYELQTTPVQKGSKLDYNHTSQYIVQVDDFFLHYLQKESMKIEFHQAFGTEYKTLAVGHLKFHELIDRSHGRLHGRVELIGLNNEESVVSIEYWIRLRVPMEQALRLYKERTKALGYLTSNELNKLESPTKQSFKDSGINELKITILQCLNLIPKIKDLQPCSYCIYKFFDFADHDTDIVKNSNFPQFHDERRFPVPMTEELDNYLKNSCLDIYVFDDMDEEETSYLGLASIPLISLSRDKPLKGKFQLKNRQGEETGSIEVAFSWEYTYTPASAKVVKYSKPVDTSVENDLSYTKPSRDTMQPMISAGKLFEPTVTSSKKHLSTDEETETLQPVLSKTNSSRPAKQTKQFSNHQDKNKQDKTMKIGDLDLTEQESLINQTTRIRADSQSDDALLEDELRRTAEMQSVDNIHEATEMNGDTMFQEESEEDETDEDIVIPATARRQTSRADSTLRSNVPRPESVSRSDYGRPESVSRDGHSFGSDETEEDDELIVSTSVGKRTPIAQAKNDITIIISSLTLFDDADLLENSSIQQLFVSYKFLDFDAEELETPMSLPKPKANRPIYFNFKKVFHIGQTEDSSSRQHLMHLLMPDHPNEGRVFFTVVSEPTDDETDECQDVGIAYVDFIQILREGEDLHDVDVDIYDLLGSEGNLIGCLTVTVEAFETLRSLYD